MAEKAWQGYECGKTIGHEGSEGGTIIVEQLLRMNSLKMLPV